MPISLEAVQKLEKGVKRAGGKKIDFAPIQEQILQSGKYYTVNEVWTNLVKKKVSRFRTKKLLDISVKAFRLERFYDGKRFFYGKPIK